LNRRVGFALLFLCLAAALPAWGRKEKSAEAQPEEILTTQQVQTVQEVQAAQMEEKTQVQVSGRLRLVGHMPFPELVISGEGGEWYVAKEEEYKLKDLQQRTVTVEGDETVIDLVFANGFPAGQRRTLANIIIVSVM